MIAALFDCDGTLTQAQFGRGLLKHASENGRKNLARQYYAALLVPFLLYKIRLLPYEPLLRTIVSRLTLLLRGLDKNGLDTVLEWSAHQHLLPSRRPEVINRLDAHRAQGHKVIIVSAQFQLNLEKIGRTLGADGVVGTSIEMKGGKWHVVPPVVTGKDKQLRTMEFVRKQGWTIDWPNSFAYADSISDMDLFDMVGNPVAVFPDAELREHALREGWDYIGETEKN